MYPDLQPIPPLCLSLYVAWAGIRARPAYAHSRPSCLLFTHSSLPLLSASSTFVLSVEQCWTLGQPHSICLHLSLLLPLLTAATAAAVPSLSSSPSYSRCLLLSQDFSLSTPVYVFVACSLVLRLR